MSEHDPDMAAFEAAQERDVEESAGDIELEALAARLIPAAVIFADAPEHVADLRRRAVEILRAALTARDAATETRNG
jgi:hypothetical protein